MPPERHLALRFFNRFLDERNIQWILALGMLIVLASSLLLVGWNWHEAGYTPWWKYLTLLGYWGLVNGAGQWGYHHLGLRKTGTVLMALAVLLVPVSFLALRWLEGSSAAGASWGAGLLALNFAVSAAVVVRVFGHFLRGWQPTFIASYLLLSLAWAVVPGIDWSASPGGTLLAALGLWLAFAVGTVKVNRHVFWLAESHQAPRVFGFLPILLLGAEFLGLFGFYLAPHVGLSWWGLGCVLVAAPVLLTADAVARIFDARTGGLVRPLPWSIVLPLGTGLLLCAGGLVLVLVELRPPHAIPPALVPTAALAAAMMGLLARRTGRSSFVWIMLLTATLAYNFSYVVCKDAVRVLLAQAASAISERRLPVAYYGLTYLPFISVLMAGVVRYQRRGNALFAEPMRKYAMILAGLLLMASGTHPKALFPVGCALTIVLGCQAVLFRERGLMLAAGMAWLSASAGFVPFVEGVSGLEFAADAWLNSLVVGTGVLMSAGVWLDRRGAALPIGAELPDLAPCKTLASIASLALAPLWWAVELHPVVPGETAWFAAIVTGVLLVVHALRERGAAWGSAAYLFSASIGLLAMLRLELSAPATIAGLTGALLVQWLVARGLPWSEEPSLRRVEETFHPVLETTSSLALTGILSIFTLLAVSFGLSYLLPWWPVYLLACAWAFDAAYLLKSPVRSALGCLALFALIAQLEISTFGNAQAVPATLAAVAVVGWHVVAALRGRIRQLTDAEQESQSLGLRAIVSPLEVILPATLVLVAVGSCLDFAGYWRLAGAVAGFGGLWLTRTHENLALRRAWWGMLNVQLLSCVVQAFAGDRAGLAELTEQDTQILALPVALAAAVSLAVWQRFADDQTLAGEVARLCRFGWRMVVAVGLYLSFLGPQLTGELPVAALVFGLLIYSEASIACRRQRVERAWLALAILLPAACYFMRFEVIPFDAWMFVCWGFAIVCCLLGKLARHGKSTTILAGPLEDLAQTLPLVTVALGIGRHFSDAHSPWLGLNSLALLLAAGFYFWQAIERGDRRYWILPGAILNLALVLLWRELEFSDPQFYMVPVGITVLALVEWLRAEIPRHLHDPLRYAGALIILVSPTFHIVEGSWLHMATLMLASVAVVLLSIGLQVRASMYMGTGFLLADLTAMLVRGSIDHPNLLWMAGLALGAAIVALAAVCENHREHLLQRIRILSAALERWN